MDEAKLRQLKNQIKAREQSSAGSWCMFLCLASYLFFQTFMIAGRISAAYIYAKNDYISLINVQFLCYYLLSPLGAIILSRIVLKIKFRLILWIGAIGSTLFMLSPYIATECLEHTDTDFMCSIWFIYFISVIISLITGVVHSFLNFGILYYITNLSNKYDKTLFYGAFFFMHNFAWMLGAVIGSLIQIQQFSQNPSEYFLMILLVVAGLSFCFMILPEGGSSQRIKSFLDRIRENLLQLEEIEKKKSQQIQLRQLLLLKQGDSDEESSKPTETQPTDAVAVNPEERIEKSGSSGSLPLLAFSMESEDQSGAINQTLLNQTLFSKRRLLKSLLITLEELVKQEFGYLIPLILNVAAIEAFGFVYLCRAIQLGTDKFLGKCQFEKSLSYCNSEIKGDTYFYAFFYLGVGQIFGCFAMGHFGNLNDKVRFLKTTSTIHSRGIATTILIQEIGCLSGLLYITMDEFFFISISASILGFCHSSMQQSIISYTIQRYTDQLFTIDIIYSLYTLGLSASALVFLAVNFTKLYSGILFLQLTGTLCLISIYFYQKKKTNDSQLHQ